jgi:plastocyanin
MRFILRVTFGFLFLFLFLLVNSARAENQITFNVISKQGLTLSDVVVSIRANKNNQLMPINTASTSAVMNQIEQQFVPHILVIKTDTLVTFPDTDSVRHHVYSFSPAKTFEISLQKQLYEHHIKFEQSGVVELGCNIHDWMLAYIYVSDGDVLGKTNEVGTFSATLPEGEYTVDIWHPRFHKQEIARQHTLIVTPEITSFTIKLNSNLLKSFTEFDEIEGLEAYD